MEKWYLIFFSMCVYVYFLDVLIDVKVFRVYLVFGGNCL